MRADFFFLLLAYSCACKFSWAIVLVWFTFAGSHLLVIIRECWSCNSFSITEEVKKGAILSWQKCLVLLSICSGLETWKMVGRCGNGKRYLWNISVLFSALAGSVTVNDWDHLFQEVSFWNEFDVKHKNTNLFVRVLTCVDYGNTEKCIWNWESCNNFMFPCI